MCRFRERADARTVYTDDAELLGRRVEDSHTCKAAVEAEGLRERCGSPVSAKTGKRRTRDADGTRAPASRAEDPRAVRLAPVERVAQSFKQWLGERLGMEQTQRVTAKEFIAQGAARDATARGVPRRGAGQRSSFVHRVPARCAHARRFAVAQLCHYTLDANPDADGDARERLTLAFSTADVVITGARLALLLEPLNQHRLASVTAMDARYANSGAPKPWVAKIVIARLDKSNGAAG